MKSLISKNYFRKQIIVSFLVVTLVFNPVIIFAVTNPAADALPAGVISSQGINTPDYSTPGQMDITQIANEAIVNRQN